MARRSLGRAARCKLALPSKHLFSSKRLFSNKRLARPASMDSPAIPRWTATHRRRWWFGKNGFSAAMIGFSSAASRSSRVMMPAATGPTSGSRPSLSITSGGGTCERGITMHPTAAPTAAIRDDPSKAEKTISNDRFARSSASVARRSGTSRFGELMSGTGSSGFSTKSGARTQTRSSGQEITAPAISLSSANRKARIEIAAADAFAAVRSNGRSKS